VTEFVVDNPTGELWPGTYVSVHFTFPSDPNVLIVPEQAVLFRTQGMQVALIGDGNKVHLQDVTIGRNLGTEVQVLTGLKATDKIVANPSQGLLEGQEVKIVQPAPGVDPSSSSPATSPPSPQQAGQPHPPGSNANTSRTSTAAE
jgi:multidrug efflux pump subunit AcrA (membrane-fusion protein)